MGCLKVLKAFSDNEYSHIEDVVLVDVFENSLDYDHLPVLW